ncbi:MAG: right-handed parallel beta-helix repeat-containing protein [Bacteroidales bacterium]|jgi:hypothetical protein|nr:right-handed parallel beta-helix repeat-containing protein [Bacteroidales bacterium]
MKFSKLLLIIFLTLFSLSISAKEYHVSKKGSDGNEGSIQYPFLTINKAAQIAIPGDIITVHEGCYREWVNPIRGGESDAKRIIYRAAVSEKAEIKGSEIISGWKKEKGGIWKVIIPNTFFKDYNPYQDTLNGDWFHRLGRVHHTGEVFLNSKSLFEKESLEKVIKPEAFEASLDQEGSLYTWYCESNNENTTIWANFHKANPNKEKVEISTRRTCFYPSEPGINYITISGFHISQAATQWGAPTAEQIGMISTHWNKGWIIENNVISDSKCSGITLGKERGTGHNTWSADTNNINRDGNIHYIEVVFNVLRNNWDKEHIGSHIVRKNEIFNCEQTGICGSMGAVFSTIENNHIHDIWTKRQFSGYEIAGIKFHAPVDATIKNNRINTCGRGIWLDWMVQGTRISANLLYDHSLEDLFVEVSHGPYLVDNNLLLSENSIKNWSQGGAYVNNLIAGALAVYYDPNRFTPYFLPHKIEMAGLTMIHGGDDRFYNNIFIGTGNSEDSPTHGLDRYNDVFLPVWLEGNVYYKQAKGSKKETNSLNISQINPHLQLIENEKGLSLKISLDSDFISHKGSLITSDILGHTHITKAKFDNLDANPIRIDTDYFGKLRKPENVLAGPFSNLTEGEHELKIW